MSSLREGPAIVVRREDYAPPAFWIDTVDLAFDLDHGLAFALGLRAQAQVLLALDRGQAPRTQAVDGATQGVCGVQPGEAKGQRQSGEQCGDNPVAPAPCCTSGWC